MIACIRATFKELYYINNSLIDVDHIGLILNFEERQSHLLAGRYADLTPERSKSLGIIYSTVLRASDE